MCPTIDGLPPKQHIECQHKNHLQNSQYFHCVDRSDVGHTMFKKPIFRNRMINYGLPLLSEKLNYNQSGIICTKEILIRWTPEDLFQLEIPCAWDSAKGFSKKWLCDTQLENEIMENITEKINVPNECILNDGTEIERMVLARLLIRDLSFKGRYLIPTNWLHIEKYQFVNLLRNQWWTETSKEYLDCDGIIETLDGSDEDLENCESHYPPAATMICEKPGIFNNFTVRIKAVLCNGIVECKHEEDEQNCNKDHKVAFFASLATGFIVTFFGAGTVVYSLDLNIVDNQQKHQHLDIGQEDEQAHQQQSDNDTEGEEEQIKNQVLLQQDEPNIRKLHNREYFRKVQRQSLGHNYAKATNKIKEQFGPSIAKTICSDSKLEKAKQSLWKRLTKKLQALQQKVLDKIPVKVLGSLNMGQRLFGHYKDMVKDIMFLIIVGQLVKDGDLFLQWAYWSLVGCLVFPFVLASTNLALHPSIFNLSFRRVKHVLFMLLVYPFLPFLLIILEHKSLLELIYCHKDQQHVSVLVNRYKAIKFQTAQFVRTELCIEQTLQVTFSILLVAFSKSTTRTAEGLEVIFDDSKANNEATFGIPSELFLVLTNILSLYSAWRSYVRGMSATKDNFPVMSQLVLALFVTISIAIRCLTSVIFLAPCLGLLDLLR